MGIVYLARDVRLDRPVALKLLPPERASRSDLRDRFLHEARMAARLAHPNIVPIHSVEEAGDFVFYAMRYVAGETLGARLRRVGFLAPNAALQILRDTAYALAYAHAQQVIHRDIKPDNILLESDGGRAVVTDFGIAWLADRDTHTGRVVGTPEYLSPEQAAGIAVDGRSDIYSLGAVGYHCITGRPPFQGDVQQLLAQHLTRTPTPIHQIAPGLPVSLADAIDRTLAKDPDQRFASAEAFAEAIGAALSPRADLPVPVRVWVERGRELKGIYVLWSCFFYGIGTMALVANIISHEWTLQALIFMSLCAASTIAPWVGHALWRLSETRRALEAGVTLDDLREGTALALARREEELRYETSRAIHPLARLIRVGTYTTFAVAIASLLAGVFANPGGRMSQLYFQLFGLSTMATVGGALFGLVFPGRRLKPRDPAARLRHWFWASALGEAMCRVARIGLRPAHHRSWSAGMPTESALGSVTSTLFAALPSPERAALADLPEVVARLEHDAARARIELAREASAVWAGRLERTVAAIETLRLGLLRISTGRAAAASLTADLDAARNLSTRIDYLVAGADEVARLLDGAHQSDIHPTASSSPASTSVG
jgi:serine/threonine-protein kinase